MDRGVKNNRVAMKRVYACVCCDCNKKAAQNQGRDEAKEDCGGFVLISTHFSLEGGIRGTVERVFAGCRVSLEFLSSGFVVSAAS